MSDIAESAVQAALVERLTRRDLGWRSVPGPELDRPLDAVLIESELVAALVRLNPSIAERPGRVDEVLPRLRATILAVRDDGLVESNRRMMGWLRGQE
jgi:type I restriction enzyme, R subunit